MWLITLSPLSRDVLCHPVHSTHCSQHIAVRCCCVCAFLNSLNYT
jgi:hypothetical protein